VKAVVITRPGPPEVLELRDFPEPRCGPEQVRIRVRAAALNRADLLQRRGLYPAPAGSPQEIPGLEFAGEIVSLGEQVRGLSEGDRVMGILGGGGYAETVCVDAGLCAAVPPGLDWLQAGAIPEAFITAYDALYRQGELQPGETLLVQAAASGVGSAAAQLALAGDVTVIALSRSEEKRRRLRALDPPERLLTGTVPGRSRRVGRRGLR
jgi:NADPH2:quinone reductase